MEQERSCMQNNQLPTKSHVELEDNDSPSVMDCRIVSATGLREMQMEFGDCKKVPDSQTMVMLYWCRKTSWL
jgi:hypothetical protein